MRRRTRLVFAIALVLTAAAGVWSAGWWAIASSTRRNVLDWIDAQRANGTTVDYAALTLDGFPFHVRLTAVDAHIADGNVDWRGTVTGAAAAWAPSRIEVTLPDTQRLTVATAGGLAPLVVTAAHGGRGSVLATDADAPLQATLTLTEVAVTGMMVPGMPAPGTTAPGAPSADQPTTTMAAVDVAISQPRQPPADHLQTGLTATVTVYQARLPTLTAAPLGAVIDRVLVALRVQGAPPPIRHDSLDRWSRDGGTVEVDALGLDWGPLKVSASGTLALDRDLQPQGAFTAELRGAHDALDAMQGTLRPKELTMARGIVDSLSRPATDGGEPVIHAPLTIQNRGLFMGPLKLAALPPFNW